MSGLVIAGVEEQVAGLTILNWNDNPSLRLKAGEDRRARYTPWVRGIVLHTTKGWPDNKNKTPQELRPGFGPDVGADVRMADIWASDPAYSGAHLVVDADGSMVCLADLQTEVSFHATVVNEVTIGIEIYQGDHSELYQGQLDCVTVLVDYITMRLGIQRQFHAPFKGPVPRIAAGAADVVGVYGHRDVTSDRSAGDPGDFPFNTLAAAGYEAFDFSKSADIAMWKSRQLALNATGATLEPDGIPGTKTRDALLASGKPRGMWIARPGD